MKSHFRTLHTNVATDSVVSEHVMSSLSSSWSLLIPYVPTVHDIYSARSCIGAAVVPVFDFECVMFEIFFPEPRTLRTSRLGVGEGCGTLVCVGDISRNISRLRFSSLQNRLRLGTYLNALSSSPVTSSLVIDIVLASAACCLEMLLLEESL